MVRVKARFNPEQGIAKACYVMVAGGIPGFVNAQGNLVFELNPVAQAVIKIDVGRLIKTFGQIAIADENRVDLPIFVSWGVRVVRPEWRPARGGRKEKKGRKRGGKKKKKKKNLPASPSLASPVRLPPPPPPPPPPQ